MRGLYFHLAFPLHKVLHNVSHFPKHFVYSSHPTITRDQSQETDSHNNNLPSYIRRVRKEGFDEKVRPPFAIENHWLLKIMTLKV